MTGRESGTLCRDKGVQENSCPVIKVEPNRSASFSMDQSCRRQIATVTHTFALLHRFVPRWAPWQKDTEDTACRIKSVFWEERTIYGSMFSHQVQGHLSTMTAVLLPELSSLFPIPTEQVLHPFKDHGSQDNMETAGAARHWKPPLFGMLTYTWGALTEVTSHFTFGDVMSPSYRSHLPPLWWEYDN